MNRQILPLLFIAASLHAMEPAPNLLQNPGFQEDTDNVGYPDGWTVSKDAKASITRDDTIGGRALVIEEGYSAVTQELSIPQLAGKQVSLNLLARSPDVAAFGVRIGFYRMNEDNRKVWTDVPLVWNKALPPQFESISATRKLPDDALDGRFWIGLYRSQRTGTVVVDELSLRFDDENSMLSGKEWIVVQREINSLRQKLVALNQQEKPGAPEAQKKLATLEAGLSGKTFEVVSAEIDALNLELVRAGTSDQPLAFSWKPTYERIRPEALPEPGAKSAHSVRLQGEYGALGVELVHTGEKAQQYEVVLAGDRLADFDFELRRQVLMETWYTKGKTLLADPLTRLEEVDGKWRLKAQPGEVIRLHLGWKTPATAAGVLPASLTVREVGGETVRSIPFEIEVLPHPRPTTPALAHYQFLYTSLNVFTGDPTAAVKDLEAHGVTDIEWPFMPRSTFTEAGELLETDWSRDDRLLDAFKDSPIRLNIFWAGSYGKLKTKSGGVLQADSPEETRAIAAVLKAYLERAEARGIPRERFTLLTQDEIHSKHLDLAPDARIHHYSTQAAALKEASGLNNYLTIGNYAFPADIQAALEVIDVAMPHWPLPTGLKRNAPEDYNPRKAYFEKTLPMLQAARKERGLEIWSYHVYPGKSAKVIPDARAYPLLAVSAGLTGFGAWSYNVSSGSTWDDNDGSMVDYILIYDGREKHPLNQQYNVTQEPIVPSILWEALREGQQDAQILLHLKSLENGGTPSPALKAAIEEVAQLGGPEGYGVETLSLEDLSRVAEALRRAYAAGLAND